MGFQQTFLTAIGEYLDAENVGRWLTTGTYSPNDTAITIDELPLTPDKAIAVGLYPVEDTPGTMSTIGVQLTIRGGKDRLSAKAIEDRAFDALHWVTGTTWAGIPIISIKRQSGANLGTDENGRQLITANYYFRVTRAGTHRTD